MTPTQSAERPEGALALQGELEESESQLSTSASFSPFGGELEFHFPCTQHIKLILPQGIKHRGLGHPSLHKLPLYSAAG